MPQLLRAISSNTRLFTVIPPGKDYHIYQLIFANVSYLYWMHIPAATYHHMNKRDNFLLRYYKEMQTVKNNKYPSEKKFICIIYDSCMW